MGSIPDPSKIRREEEDIIIFLADRTFIDSGTGFITRTVYEASGAKEQALAHYQRVIARVEKANVKMPGYHNVLVSDLGNGNFRLEVISEYSDEVQPEEYLAFRVAVRLAAVAEGWPEPKETTGGLIAHVMLAES